LRQSSVFLSGTAAKPRRKLAQSSPRGIPHGPHPGAAEASIGKEGTEELAVMMDTFRPLRLTAAARAFDDPDYPFSWLEDPTPHRGPS
jgi:homogentisate 1,2-dioxygenase